MNRTQRRRASALLAAISLHFAAFQGASAQLPALISRTDFFACTESASAPFLSPDGLNIAYFANNDQGRGIFCNSVKGGAQTLLFEHPQMRTSLYGWAQDNRHLICFADPDGKENWGLFTLDAKERNKELHPVAFIMNTQVRPVRTSRLFPAEMLVAINYTSPSLHDVYRVNLLTGARVLVFKNPGQFTEFFATDSLKVLGGMIRRGDGSGAILVRKDTSSQWRQVLELKPNEKAEVHAFSRDEEQLYLSHDLAGEHLSLYRCTLADMSVEKIFSPPEGEIRNVWFSRREGRPALVESEHMRTHMYAVDSSYDPDLKALAEKQPASSFRVIGRDSRDSLWIVCYWSSVSAPGYYAYARKSRSLSFLFSSEPVVSRLPLAKTRDVEFHARDGMLLYGYLTLPAGVPARNLPLVVLVHGGPAARDSWAYFSEPQWLANRGYAVLQVNFRGSQGFGKSYFAAGFSQWGTAMVSDIVDGARWAADSGIADSSRMAIMGWSFGGYASIAAAAFYPHVFRCAVDICGPTDLVSFIKNAPAYWGTASGFMKNYLGDWEKNPEKLKSMSPLLFASQVAVPVLVAHGEQDPRVNVHQARKLVAALTNAHKNVSYLEFPSEGHGFVYQRSQMLVHGMIEDFLKRNIGGRSESLSYSESEYAETVQKQTKRAMEEP